MSDENVQDSEQTAADSNNPKAPVRRLTYGGRPGEEGYERKLKVITQCFQYKSALFGTGKRAEFYKLVADDCNKYHPELFNNMLKDNSVRDLWNKAVKEADAQQEDKEKRHHLWFNGSKLRDMTEWELLLDEIFTEKKAIEGKKQAEQEREAAEEKDKRERLNAAFSRVEERYNNANGAGAAENSPSPEKRDEGPGPSKSVSPDKEGEGAYGRGEKKGNQHHAKGNRGLTPDVKNDKLADACAKQSEIASSVSELLEELKQPKRKSPEDAGVDEEEREMKREELRISKMAATASLMETYLKFQQSGVEMPAMFKDLLN